MGQKVVPLGDQVVRVKNVGPHDGKTNREQEYAKKLTPVSIFGAHWVVATGCGNSPRQAGKLRF